MIDRSIDEKIQRLILILFIFTSCCITMRLRFSTRPRPAVHQARFRAAGVRIISSFEALSIAAPSAPTMVDVGEMDRVLMGVFGLWMGGGIGMLRSAGRRFHTLELDPKRLKPFFFFVDVVMVSPTESTMP